MSTVINNPNMDMYYVTPEGVTVQGRTKVYANHQALKRDTNPGKFAWVLDASADPTVNEGAAFYYRKGKTWQKLYESEAMDNENFGKPEGWDELVEAVRQLQESNINVTAEEKEFWNNKLSPEEGKGLSQNDYTDQDKQKLASLENYDDTALKARVTTVENEKADLDVVLGLQNRVGLVEEELIGVKHTIAEIQDLVGIDHEEDESETD